MKNLYIAFANAMNYVVIRDFEREDNDAAIIDFDLSDNELREMLEAFEAGEAVGMDPEWMAWDEIMENMNGFQDLAAYLEED